MKDKTNVMRKLDSMKLSYQEHFYTHTDAVSGVDVAAALGQDPEQVFKTLVATGRTGIHYVFMIPVAKELDLKKAAKAVGEKSMEMLNSKNLLGITGYMQGGCSPIGMKKFFRTTIHQSAANLTTIIFSGGKIGYQVELAPAKLRQVIKYEFAEVVK